MSLFLTILATVSLLSSIDTRVGTAASSSPTSSIFGSQGEVYGNTLPAVTEPHGQTFWTPQTRDTELKGHCPYYYEDDAIQGFRASHWLVGGATQDYGSFTVMPGNGPLFLNANERASGYSHDSEIATPSLYEVHLDRYGIEAAMTGVSHSAIWTFTDTEWIVVQVNSDEGEGTLQVNVDDKVITGVNPVHRIYQGLGLPAGFCGCFYLTFDAEPLDAGVIGDCAYVRFAPSDKPVCVKAATSFTSVDAAEANLEAEIPDWDFNAVRTSLDRIWEEHLSRIEVSTDDEDLASQFYGSLWRASLLPRTVSDAGDPEKRYDDFSLWDTYRALHPLLTILEPSNVGNMISSILDRYDKGGWLPIFPCWGSYTSAMIGDHAISVICDAYLKGIRNFNVRKAYAAMRKNAFETPGEDSPEYKDGRGRRALTSYLQHGYVPLEDNVPYAFHPNEQVSRTLEYSYDDWCLWRVSRKLGTFRDQRALKKRARNWMNVFDPRTGYVNGRHADGTFADPDNYLEKVSFITEGTPAHYSWYVPHDVNALIEVLGGRESFVSRLDSMFSEKRYWHGNEPCHQIAYLYDYAGQAWKTQAAVRNILHTEYRNEPGGLSGNDDAGQMSAWYIFSTLGFYPVCPGSCEYALGSPCFKHASIRLENGKVFTVDAVNASDENIYVQSVRLNGRKLRKPFISHRDIVRGGRLSFEMGLQPSVALNPGRLKRPGNVFVVDRFGAKGDGQHDDAAAIQKAIDKCSSRGGGKIVFKSGRTYLSGPVELKGGIEYVLESNSVLLANPDESIYRLSAFGKNEGEGMLWLYARDAENISISGTGAIDGNGVAFMGEELEDSYELMPVTTFDPRPHVLTFYGVDNLNIKDVTVRNGAYWTIHLVGCHDAHIDGVKLLNNLKIRNGDGIDIDHSTKVRISDCHIESGDDCICLKNRREFEEYGVCGDVIVTNCTMTSRSCAVKIGSENMDTISDVFFDNCVIRASNRGIGIQNRDEGTVRNVVFSNMRVEGRLFSDVWWGKAEPIYVTSYPRANANHKDANWRFPPGAVEGRCGEVSDIWFRNIVCRSENGCFIGGDEPGKVHDIHFDGVSLTLTHNGKYEGGVYDIRPCRGEGFIAAEPQYCYIDCASDIYFDGKKIL